MAVPAIHPFGYCRLGIDPLGTIRVDRGHSTRVGAAQDMVAHNLGLSAIQQAVGWRSPRMAARDGERPEAKRSGAAVLARIQGR